jgi:hypothetical protein
MCDASNTAMLTQKSAASTGTPLIRTVLSTQRGGSTWNARISPRMRSGR